MNLYIFVDENNQPINHPIIESNLLQAFPDIDLENLPSGIVKFHRTAQPPVGLWQVNEGNQYQYSNGDVFEIWNIRDMTEEEKTEKKNKVKADWAENTIFISWVFNEEMCRYEPPIPMPSDGKMYFWDEESVSWKSF